MILKLTLSQLAWLYSRGGRRESDVIYSENVNPYIIMGKKNQESIEIPNDEEIAEILSGHMLEIISTHMVIDSERYG